MIGCLIRKELEIDTSSRRMAVVRSLAIAFLLFWLTLGLNRFSFGAGDASQYARYGREMFSSLAWTVVLGVLLLGPALTIGAVATERRKGTLGMLYLVGFTPATVVAGKFVARFAALALVILCTLPVFLFVYAYGGVSYVEMVVVYTTALCAGAWGCALGLLMSVLNEQERAAMVASVGCITLYCGIPLAVTGRGGPASVLDWLGPLSILDNALGRGLLGPQDLAFGAPWLAADLALVAQAAVFVALGAFALPRLSLGAFRPGMGLSWIARPFEPLVPAFVPKGEWLLEAEDAETGFNPFAWREAYGRGSLDLRLVAALVGLATACLVGAYGGLGLCFPDEFARLAGEREVHAAVALVLVGLAVVITTTLAAASIAAEKDDKSLEVMLLLGSVSYRYVYGKFLGLFWISLLLGVPALVHCLVFTLFGPLSLAVPLGLVLLLPQVLAVTIAHGLYFSLRCRTEVRAVGTALAAQVLLFAVQATGLVCCPFLLFNPVYFIALSFGISGRTWDPLSSLFLLGVAVPVVCFLAYKVNRWYVEQVLWRITSQFNDRMREHFEGEPRAAG